MKSLKKLLRNVLDVSKIILTISATLVIIGGALYMGAWVCFVGGICQIVEGIKATPTDGVDIGIGLLRTFLAAPIGWATFFCGVVIGKLLLDR